jgi:RNA polymerase sigma factor (sigma-70 family)
MEDNMTKIPSEVAEFLEADAKAFKKGAWKLKFVGVNDYIINNYSGRDTSEEDLLIARLENDTTESIETFDLHTAIALLSEAEQKLINAYYFEGKTFEDIAGQLGCSKQNVQQKIKRITRSMKP